MKKVLVFLSMGLVGFAVSSFAQDRSANSVAQVQRVQQMDRVQQARIQQARIMQARVDQVDLTQRRVEQARLSQARVKQARIENARHKQQRIKQARIKEARLDAAGEDQLKNRRRYHKAKMQNKRKRLANQDSGEGA